MVIGSRESGVGVRNLKVPDKYQKRYLKTLAYWPRYANNLTTFNFQPHNFQPHNFQP
ncbi:MAG: hypothetical protein F6K26_15525 [Moorea sp. SIO2I5]|nr:hypothetical protein [Moorena sp. SIO2I5]